MSNSFERLILKYANGRKICNCGNAYRNAEGNCKYGCSANQIFAKEYVAAEAEKEIAALEILLNLKPLTGDKIDDRCKRESHSCPGPEPRN